MKYKITIEGHLGVAEIDEEIHVREADSVEQALASLNRRIVWNEKCKMYRTAEPCHSVLVEEVR